MSRRNAFGHKTGRAGIKCYRAAGRMFGQAFATRPAPIERVPTGRHYAAIWVWGARRRGVPRAEIRAYIASWQRHK